MNEKTYHIMKKVGAFGIVIGIVTIVAGIVCGVLSIVNGAGLLKRKSDIMF